MTKLLKHYQKYCEKLKGEKLLGSDHLFPGRFGFDKPISTRAFMYALDDATLKAKITKFSSHGFRRTALSSGNEKGISLRTLQEISGHKSLRTLQEYLDVSDKQKLEAVNAFA